MIEPLIADLRAALAGNEFFAGGFVLMGISAVVMWLRRTPVILWMLGQRQYSVGLEVRDFRAIRWLDLWLKEQPYGKRCRRLKVEIFWPPGDGAPPNIVMTPGLGRHLLRWRGRYYLIERAMEKGKEGGGGDGPEGGFSVADLVRKEVLNIRTLGRNSQPIRDLLEECWRHFDSQLNRAPELRIGVNRMGDWFHFRTGDHRPLDSVVLAEGLAEDIVQDARAFLSESRRAWYRDRGIPWRRGYLLDGPPGNGKSSLVRALAGELNLALYWLDLTEEKISDVDVTRLLAGLPPRALVYVEDADRIGVCRTDYVPGNRGESDPRVTLSGLLNAIDGIAAGEGRILILTANHSEVLQPALVREGRIDRRWTIGHATREQAERIFLRFFPEEALRAGEFGRMVSAAEVELSMGAIQEILIRHAEDPKAACHELARRTREAAA